MGRVERQRELARKRKRREKLRKLRAKFRAATDEPTRQAIIEKVRRVSPFVNLEEEEKEKAAAAS